MRTVISSLLIGAAVGSNGVYDEKTAIQMVTYSAASYCCGTLGHGVEKWDCAACKKLPHLNTTVFYNQKLNVNGYVGLDAVGGNIIVAFAGTDPLSIQDWIDDIDFVKTKYPACDNGCEVHEGFYKSYESVMDEVRGAVAKYEQASPGALLYVTGHSLGAALATHAALDLHSMGQKVEAIYTFGQPRVGDANFASWEAKTSTWPSFRVTHERDPVPHLPLEGMGFKHVPLEVFYNQFSTSFKVCNGSGEDPKCSNKFLADIDILDHLDYLKYDFTANYLECKL